MARIVTDYIEDNYKQYPDKIIFADDKKEISVEEFRGAARRIATVIISYNCFKKPVAIYMDKSIESLISFMGVAYSGNFYTPLDTMAPLYRIRGILDILKPHIIISDKKHINMIKEVVGEIICICYEDIVDSEPDDDAIDDISDRIIDLDALYVLFTSGSTGIPKGVIVSHKSVISYAEWVTKTFGISKDTVFGNQTPFYFSMSVLDIFATIRACAKMYILPKQLFSFPVRLLEFIRDNKINTIYWVPSALCLVVNLKVLGTRDISCIKKVLFAGEAMPSKQLNAWRRELPDALFANLFGPTEFTDISNYYIIERQLSDNEPVPIGNSCKNTDSFIVDDNGKQVVNRNIVGELYIRGTCLAYGYYNNQEKTKEVFVQNPLNSSYPETVYKTGDMVHINDLGELIYDGRRDHQIKHMGHRVELGEIETAADSIESVDRNCCIYDNENKRIVLLYCGHSNEDQVKEELCKLVPKYMVPAEIMRIKTMPLNSNGKIDRRFLWDKYSCGEIK